MNQKACAITLRIMDRRKRRAVIKKPSRAPRIPKLSRPGRRIGATNRTLTTRMRDRRSF